MLNSTFIPALRLLCVFFAFCSVFLLIDDVFAAPDKKRINVNCQSMDLQEAIDDASPGQKIFLNGTCSGEFVVTRDDLILSGNPDDLACNPATPGGLGTIEGTLVIQGVRARVEHLTITGAGMGIEIKDRATADLHCNDISSNQETGIVVIRSSNANLTSNNVSSNGLEDLVQGSEDPTRNFHFGLFVADASSVYSNGNTYSQNSYGGIAADRASTIRNGTGLPNRPGFAPDPAEKDIIVQRGCSSMDISGCDASALGAFDSVAVESFNLAVVDLRNAEVTGLVDNSATATFRMDVTGFLLGDVSNLANGMVRLRNRNLDNGRTLDFTGTLHCDASSGTFFSTVQCGQTCTGLDGSGNLQCAP